MTNYDTLKEYEAHKEPLPRYDEYKRLQEQLKEANDIIISIAAMPRFPINPELCREYLEKWGVK